MSAGCQCFMFTYKLIFYLGRNLLDWIGLGTGPETDPYLARTNAACLDGDLAECFKSRALASLDEFFEKVCFIC